MCNNCIHKPVCSKFAATGGHVRECEHFKEERRGEWETITRKNIWGDMVNVLRCSRCKRSDVDGRGITIKSDYCPNCGADMRGEKDG